MFFSFSEKETPCALGENVTNIYKSVHNHTAGTERLRWNAVFVVVFVQGLNKQLNKTKHTNKKIHVIKAEKKTKNKNKTACKEKRRRNNNNK